MSIQEVYFKDIADALREKTGLTGKIKATAFAATIRSIQVGGGGGDTPSPGGCTEASYLHMPVIISDQPLNDIRVDLKLPNTVTVTLPMYSVTTNLTIHTESFCVEEV